MIYERSCHKTSDYIVSNDGVINERWQGSEIEKSATIREFASRDSENLQQNLSECRFSGEEREVVWGSGGMCHAFITWTLYMSGHLHAPVAVTPSREKSMVPTG